jgi:CRP-like cAMP-binding protein
MPNPSSSYKIRNVLLKRMSPSDLALLQPHFESLDMPRGAVLAAANQRVEHVYFPEGGVTSIVTVEPTGKRAEVGLFGREGMSGTCLLLGADRSPLETFVQINGSSALRIGRASFLTALRSSDTLHRLLGAFAQSLAMQVSYTATSNANYVLKARLARWLLMCHDRVDGPDLDLTHEFLAMMLGVRRAGVTVMLKQLESDGAIMSRRGIVSVVSRNGLEAIAGDAYGAPEAEYHRLIGSF